MARPRDSSGRSLIACPGAIPIVNEDRMRSGAVGAGGRTVAIEPVVAGAGGRAVSD